MRSPEPPAREETRAEYHGEEADNREERQKMGREIAGNAELPLVVSYWGAVNV